MVYDIFEDGKCPPLLLFLEHEVRLSCALLSYDILIYIRRFSNTN